MTDSYSFQGGTFDPVEQVDVLPEMERVNAQIERSENEFFDALRENDKRELENIIRQDLVLVKYDWGTLMEHRYVKI